MAYFNTTNEQGNDLKKYIGKASKQDNILARHFESNPDGKYSPSDLWVNLFETTHVPLTSCRRSLNTLMKRGLIVKLSEKQDGIYGRPESLYELKKTEGQLGLF